MTDEDIADPSSRARVPPVDAAARLLDHVRMSHFHHSHHHRGATTITIGGRTGALINIIVMFAVGLLLLGMGVVFVAIALNVPILRDSFVLTGGILACVGMGMVGGGVVMWLRRANADRLRASGVAGQAQIVGLNQTNFYVNGQPVVDLQLMITTPMLPPYTITKRETVPVIMLARLTSGGALPVMVDPAKPDNIVIVWEQGLG
jgi:hypothetical protein